jgi:TolA-binding protein
MPIRGVVLSLLSLALLAGAFTTFTPITQAQKPEAGKPSNSDDLDLVQQLNAARRDYQKTLEQLRAHYLQAGDLEKAKWAEEELLQYHRISKQAFRLDLDVPTPKLQGSVNITEANRIFTKAMEYKNIGWGNDYIDNQRRAELLFQQLLTQYPQCNKISDTAYQLGDLYESKAYNQYRRSAMYFERCYQWNPITQSDARIRAARIYDRRLQERGKAIDIYREIITHETDSKRIQEANKRLQELSGR